MKTVKTFTTLLVLAMTGLSVQAVAVELKAGKWGFTSESTGMMGSDGEEYSEQCMAEPFDPMGEMMASDVASLCEVQINEKTENSYNADLSCNVPGGGNMSGKVAVNVTSGGNAAEGMFDINMTLGDQTMNMVNATFEAEYLGACD